MDNFAEGIFKTSHLTVSTGKKTTTPATSKGMGHVRVGNGGSRLETNHLRIESLGIAVLGVWLHLSNIEVSILKARAILVILVVTPNLF